jgi:hypothetical protein
MSKLSFFKSIWIPFKLRENCVYIYFFICLLFDFETETSNQHLIFIAKKRIDTK